MIRLFLLMTPLFHLSAQPLIVAHRGASADAPENTLPAFELAWEQEADAVEGDFHLTRDKQIVCIHNENTNKYTGKSLKLRKTKLADLQALDYGTWKSPEFANTHLPTFADVLATVPAGKKFYIEIKSSPKILRHLFKEIDASEIDPSQLVVISFSGRVIKKIKSARPSLKAIWLTAARRRAKGEGLEPTPKQILSEIKRTGADGVSIYAHPDIDAAYLQPIHDAGHELHVWTIDDPETAKKWIELGALSITTNTPGQLRKALEM